jgi:hypothetical protein
VPSKIAFATSATSARLQLPPRDVQDLLLHERNLLDGKLDAEIAPRHHHAIGVLDDLLRVPRGQRLLDLRDQGDVAVAQVGAYGLEVFAPAHERERDEVDPHLDPGVDQRQVLAGHGRERDGDVRQVDPLPRGERAAHLDAGADLLSSHLADPQAHGTVRQVDNLLRLDQLGEARPCDGQAAIPGLAVLGGHQRDVAADRQLNDVPRNGAEP